MANASFTSAVLFDTVAMTLSFEPEKTSILLGILRAHYATISSGFNLPHAEIRSTAGKLSWYAQVLQSDRLHTRAWWLYVVFGHHLIPPSRARLLLDTAWWIDVLVHWPADVNAPQMGSRCQHASTIPVNVGAHIPGKSVTSLDRCFRRLRSRQPRVLLQSYTPAFLSAVWSANYRFVTSHCGELTALWHYVERTCSNCLLVWVSDSQSAVIGVNKETCRPDDGLAVLVLTLSRCDDRGIVFLEFWIPRELNRVSDYLSHLSTLLRSDAAGTFDADAAADLLRRLVRPPYPRPLHRCPCRRRGPSCRKFARQQPSAGAQWPRLTSSTRTTRPASKPTSKRSSRPRTPCQCFWSNLS